MPLLTRLIVTEVPHFLSETKSQDSEINYLQRCYLQLIYIKSFKLIKIDESLKKNENEYAIKIKEGKIYISKALYVRHIFQMYAFMYLCCNPGS